MSIIKYFVLPDNKDVIGGNVAEPNGFPDALINPQKDTDLKEYLEKNQVEYGHLCDKINTFVWNGFTYYCSAKTAQAMEKKFKIDRVITDREQQKEIKEKEKEIKQEMRTDEWLENKLIEDCAELFASGLKRYKFVQEVRDRNTDIAHARMTRQIQKMFNDDLLNINDKGLVRAGNNFPQDTLITKEIVEETDLYGRVRRRAKDTTA